MFILMEIYVLCVCNASIKALRQLLVWPYSKQIFNNLNCTDNLVLQFANCAQFWSAREWLSISMKSKGLYQFIIFVPGNPLTNNFWWSWKNSWRELFDGINKSTWWFDSRCQIGRFPFLWMVRFYEYNIIHNKYLCTRSSRELIVLMN